MSFSIKLGNFLYKNAYVIYKPLYAAFKNRQDAFEISLLKQHIQKNDKVLDIGANIGFYATLISEIVGPAGEVHCFEPDAQNFDHLKKATEGRKNIILNNKAVGPKSEKIKIYTSKDLNVDHRTYKPETFEKELEIDAVSIDDYLFAAGDGKSALKIDFIKIDIQGFEMEAIQGMQKTLANNPGLKLISEFWPYGLNKAGSSVSAYFNFLTDKGFNCYLLEKNTLEKLTLEKVRSLETLGEAHYFNIFASRKHV